jgi:DNA-binding transcriptional regulator LsrR (DeoR family)
MKLISHTSRRGAPAPRPGELRQLVQCLELYYRQGRSQKDIAQQLGVSAATVSRLLKRAMDDGFVRVELDLPRTQELEAELIAKFGLRDAVVIAAGGRADVREALGVAAAAYFEKAAASGMRVGVSCGLTLYHTVRALRERRFRDLAVYPLSGESTLKLVDISPNTLVGMMAAKYRPHVTAFALPVQHLISLRAIERERRRLLRDAEVRAIYDAAQAVAIALVGIGQIAERTPGFCSLAESYGVSVRRLRELGVVGEVNYQPFDAAGRLVDRPELRALTRRVLAVTGERLQELSRRDDRHVIAVAGGKGKIDAIRGALRGRFVNVLVTDEDVSAGLLGG